MQDYPQLWSRVAASPPKCTKICCSDFATYQDAPVIFNPTLTNDIHPIFAPTQFPPDIDYDVITPSLRLATRLLALDAVSRHIAIMANGEMRVKVGNAEMQVEHAFLDRLRDEEGAPVWPRVSRHAAEYQSRGVARAQAEKVLSDVVPMVHFIFSPTNAAGKTFALEGPVANNLQERFPRGCRSLITLQPNTYSSLLQHRDLHVHGAESLLDHFYLATILLHELGHGLINSTSGLRKSEFFLSHSPLAEAGYSLEHAALGYVTGWRCSTLFERRRGEYCPAGKLEDFSRNVMLLYEWPSGCHQDCYVMNGHKMAGKWRVPSKTKVRRLSLSFLKRMFEERFWEGLVRTGAESVQVDIAGEWEVFWHHRGHVSELRPCISLGEVNQK